MGTQMMKQCALLLLGTLLCTTIKGQSKDTLFKPLYETTKVKSLRSTFTHSDSITLDGLGTIYALAIDATVTQPRESSFVRVVLEDKEGHQYLVAECDRFRYDQDEVRLEQFCQETAALKGIVPACLRCYVAGEATIQISAVHASSNILARGTKKTDELDTILREQVHDIVNRINVYNQKHRKLWKAGINKLALANFEDRIINKQDLLFDAYSENAIYYAKGIYEFGEPSTREVEESSLYVDSFDWRNRHGICWVTKPKNQEESAWCAVFSVIGMMEAYTNLYYNDTLNLNLSEKDLALSSGLTYHTATLPTILLQQMASKGVIDEETEPFDSIPSRVSPRDSCIDLIRIPHHSARWFRANDDTISVLKDLIINKGPLISGVVINYWGMNHEMLLVGYGKVTPNILYSYIDNDGIHTDSISDNRLGKTYFIFKNSYYGNDPYEHNGYMYALFHWTKRYLKTPEYLYGTLDSKRNYEIQCKDDDGDGFFTWGIGHSRPSSCPAWAAREQDGDDSDYDKGPINTYGHLSIINVDAFPVTSIDTVEIYNSKKYFHGNIIIESGASLTVTSELLCYKGVSLTVKSNASLIIDGGQINNVRLVAEPGCQIIIKNGGSLQCNKNYPFDIQEGVVLQIENGVIV